MATLLGTLFLGAAGLVSSVIGFAAFLYNRVLATPDPRLSGPLRPIPDQQERFKVVQQRFASSSMRMWRRTWPVCAVVALAGVVLIAVG